jgi:predicted nucleic acid-binding protein
MALFTVIPIDTDIVKQSFALMVQYGFSNWDSLILAAAIKKSCTRLYSEDLQHGQIIKQNLTIINPFLSP